MRILLSRKGRLSLSLALSLTLLFCACAAPTAGNAAVVHAPGYEPHEILDYFTDIAFGSEYGGYRGTVCKWTEPITLSLEGAPTEADIALIDTLCSRLNEIPGFPGISRAETEETANFVLRFVPQGELSHYFGSEAENVRGMSRFTYRVADGGIFRAEAGVASNITPESAKSSVISEELLQSLGLASDSYTYEESIFYEGYTRSLTPVSIDWALLEILYHESIAPGMAYGDALKAAARLLGLSEDEIISEETMYG